MANGLIANQLLPTRAKTKALERATLEKVASAKVLEVVALAAVLAKASMVAMEAVAAVAMEAVAALEAMEAGFCPFGLTTK